MGDLQIITMVLGALRTNCYFIYNEQTRKTVIIDPGDNAYAIQKKCETMMLYPEAILLTHGHFDHIMAAEDVKKTYSVPVYAGIAEQEILLNPYLNCGHMMNINISLTADKWLNNNEILNMAGVAVKVINTPGHTAGSVCYYIEDENALFSGDTLFRSGYGRTDFPTGSQIDIRKSIINKLFVLPEKTTVYPGHGDKTEISYEKVNNFL